MGRRVETDQGVAQGDLRGAARVPARHQAPSGTRETQKTLLEALFLSWRRFFGNISFVSKGVVDPRVQGNVRYPLDALFFACILGFVCRLHSGRDWKRFLRDHPEASQRFAAFLPGVPGFPHPDTIKRTFCQLDTDQVQDVVTGAVDHLIRGRVFDAHRLLDCYYQIAIDASGVFSFGERHCDHCLTRKQGGKTIYFHYVLEAKLVTTSGFALSLMTEFLENPGDEPFDKQDCELKAFSRLAKRLKQRFPRLPLVLLLDGLYACGGVFQICKDNNWKYLAVLKKGSIPSLVEEFQELASFEHEDHFTVTANDGPGGCQERRQLRWVNRIDYQDSDRRQHKVHVLEALVSHPNEPGAKLSTWLWVTNIPITPTRADQIQKGGRCRWKIENEGFNVQKTGGYGLEHVYCHDWTAAKVYYFLIQVAHGVHQLLEKGSLLRKAFPTQPPSGRFLANLLIEAWRNAPRWSRSILDRLRKLSFQLRLDTS